MLAQIQKLIEKTAHSAGWKFEPKELRIFWAKNSTPGSIVTNIAFLLSATTNQSTATVAASITPKLIANNKIGLVSIKPLANGYIEFLFPSIKLNEIVGEVLKFGPKFGQSNYGQKRKVLYEWISANPTGNLHIGHLRNAIIGESTCRLLEFVGFDVAREFYINDAGAQITAAGETLFNQYQKHFGHEHKTTNKLYPETDYILPTKLFVEAHGDEFANTSWADPAVQKKFVRFTRDHFLERFRQINAELDIHFDRWYSEKHDIQEKNKTQPFFAKLEKAKLIAKKDGAIWFLAQKLGFENNIVLVKSTGQPTYFLHDWIYHDEKFIRGFEFVYDLWGADHDSHLARIKGGLRALGHPPNFEVDVVQMVSLTDSDKILKLSKRAGNIIAWSDFVSMLGADFARFMLMTRKRTRTLLLDVDLALLRNSKNPVFYVQYAHARAHQLLAKHSSPTKTTTSDYSALGGAANPTEQELIVALHQFPATVLQGAKQREPHLIVSYLIAISKQFHSYYQNTPILHSSSPALTEQRAQLVRATAQVIANGLNLLGVSAPQKM